MFLLRNSPKFIIVELFFAMKQVFFVVIQSNDFIPKKTLKGKVDV